MTSGVYQRYPIDPIKRLLVLTMPVTECGCWIFMGCLSQTGYGRFTTKTNLNRLAHRVSYELFIGPIPERMGVLHRCDIPSCINPNHLYIGSHAENMKDMAQKGRAQTGERHKGAKLTAENVRAIRTDPRGCTSVARDYSVGIMTILDVRARRTWAHID